MAHAPLRTERPWPRPHWPWVMSMRWHELLFMHWPLPVELLRPLIPARLAIDTYEGQAWLGIVPFRMSRVRPRLVSPLPKISWTEELNVRTYVTAEEKPGVWFFSLDCARLLAVWGARIGFFLPYFHATMSLDKQPDGTIQFASRRTHRGAVAARFEGEYRPSGPVAPAVVGSLDDFLTSRYCLYSADGRGRVYRAEIDHRPWPLQPATATTRENTMTDQLNLRLPDAPPLLHYSDDLEVVAWWRTRVPD